MSDAREHLVAVCTAYVTWCAYVVVLAAADGARVSGLVESLLSGLPWAVAVAAVGAWTYSGRSFLPDQSAAALGLALIGWSIVDSVVIVLAPLGFLLFMVSGTASSE